MRLQLHGSLDHKCPVTWAAGDSKSRWWATEIHKDLCCSSHAIIVKTMYALNTNTSVCLHRLCRSWFLLHDMRLCIAHCTVGAWLAHLLGCKVKHPYLVWLLQGPNEPTTAMERSGTAVLQADVGTCATHDCGHTVVFYVAHVPLLQKQGTSTPRMPAKVWARLPSRYCNSSLVLIAVIQQVSRACILLYGCVPRSCDFSALLYLWYT